MNLYFAQTLRRICGGEHLTREQTRAAFEFLMSGSASEAQIGGLLVGLAAKGSTVDELVGAAEVMRRHVVPVDHNADDVVLDTCGTGGDVKGTFNISTAAAIITAAAGVKVVKHGNRSASGNAGSADVLEALGFNLDASPAVTADCLATADICFAFARTHHPAMRHVAAARKSLGIPTLFNLLGPLTNPAGARHQLLGVFAPELTQRMAEVLGRLGSARAWVVHADDGLDEISTMGPTRISELDHGTVRTFRLDPADLGLPRASLASLQVGSVAEAAAALRSVVDGKPGPMADIAAINAAAAMFVAGKVESLFDGLASARRVIADGSAGITLDALVETSKKRLA